jgi:glycerol dehydrogenase
MKWIEYLKKKKLSLEEYGSFSLKVGPSIYIQEKNLLPKVGYYCKGIGEFAGIICDENIYKKFCKDLSSSFKSLVFIFSGECCLEEINKIIENIKKANVDFIFGMGGGKTLDTAKLVGFKLNLPVVAFATSASTCSAWTNVSVLYSKDGIYKDIINLKKSPDLTLVDEDIIIDAPKELLLSGIGDSFAKYYEARLVYESGMFKEDVFAKIGIFIADEMYKIIKEKNSELKEIIYANIALCGLVSTIGRESCSALLAHSFVNALSIIPQARKVLHGYLASLGVVFQFKFLNKDFPELQAYKELGLPLSFKDINICLKEKDIEEVSKLILEDETVCNFYPDLNLNKIVNVLKQLSS